MASSWFQYKPFKESQTLLSLLPLQVSSAAVTMLVKHAAKIKPILQKKKN